MLRSVSLTHVLNRVREVQFRRTSDDQLKIQQDFLVVSVVTSAIEMLNNYGFKVAKEVEDDSPSAAIAALVLEKWKLASSAERQQVRTANPELGLALDRMETGDAPA